MPNEMSSGEMGRALERIERKQDALSSGFDGWRELVIRIEHQVGENTKDIADIQSKREAEKQDADKEKREIEKARTADRRLIFTALVAPAIVVVLGIVLQVLLSARPS